MLTRDKEGLRIFENFETDKKLPKYQKEESTQYSNSIEWGTPQDSGNWIVGNSAEIDIKPPWYKSFFKKVSKKLEKPKVTPQQFFENIKNQIKSSNFKPELYDKRVEGFMKTRELAVKAGQTSLIETLDEKLNTVKYENALYATGNVTTITEEQVVTFYKESDKGIRLDWIKNFNRIIPTPIVEKKVEMDGFKIFDNYVVMHYDPNKKSYKKTQEEIDKEKDPILFGVIKGINKLYFIADWQDEYCDLTLDAFIDKFGKDGIDANNITVNF